MTEELLQVHNPEKPQLLFVTPVFPSTTGYGLAMRAGALLKALATDNSVYLLIIPVYDPDRKTLPKSMRGLCKQYHILNISMFDRLRARLKSLGQYISKQAAIPYVSLFTSARLVRAVERAFDQIHFDYLYVFRIYMTPFALPYLSRASLKGRYLDLDDVESITRSRLAARFRANGLHRQARHEEQAAQLYATYERKFLPKFDGISVCSWKDKIEIEPLVPNRNIHVLPNVVSPTVVSPSTPNAGTFNMLFVGNLNYYPNQDALAFFLGDVLPILRSRAKRSISFTIIGSGKWQGLHRYRDIADCRYVGFVPDVSPYYEQSDAVVVPLRAGGGTRIKVLEAFSFNRPVVTTSIGVEGINVEHEKHVLIADQPESFAKQCCRIMEDQQLSEKLTTNSLVCLNDNYTPDVLHLCLSKMMA